MNKQVELISELYKAFRDIDYYDDTHSYYSNGNRMESVTKVIGSYKEFRRGYWLVYKTLRAQGVKVVPDVVDDSIPKDYYRLGRRTHHYKEFDVDTSKLAKEWDRKSKKGKKKGTKKHHYLEAAVYNKFKNKRLKGCDIFLKENKHLIPVRLEMVVSDKGRNIAGQFDALFWNENKKRLELHDYKTDKDIHKGFGKMLPPFENIEATNLNKYILQLNMYALFLEENTSLKVDHLQVNWIREEGYECIPIKKDLKLAKLMLDDFKRRA